MMKKNTLFVSLTLLVGLFAISMFLLPANVLAKNIKVGVIDCYSGPAAFFGNDALNGFKLALKEINAEGVLGSKIEFTTRDSKFKVDLALNFAKELVLRENVDILVGTINSGAALAISEAVAKREKVPFIAWISKSENIT
ncbi:MAG: ABC transporter substrate-binding protein, partial [Desulfobacterales bacterium]